MKFLERKELDSCRQVMLEMFFKVATPDNKEEIKIFLGANDRHQEILAGDGDIGRGQKEFDPNEGREC